MSNKVLIPKNVATCPECNGQLHLEGGFVMCVRTADLLRRKIGLVGDLCVRESNLTRELQDAWALAGDKATAWADERKASTFSGVA